MATLVLTKEVLAYFFLKGPTENIDNKLRNIYNCKCEELMNRKCHSIKNSFTVIANTGSSNLKKHLEICMPDYIAHYKGRVEVLLPGAGDIRQFVSVDKKSQTIYDWLEWIIDDNLSFNFISKPLTRKNTKLDSMSINTYMKYLDSTFDVSNFCVFQFNWNLLTRQLVVLDVNLVSQHFFNYKLQLI
jgi:hypothetical protein